MPGWRRFSILSPLTLSRSLRNARLSRFARACLNLRAHRHGLSLRAIVPRMSIRHTTFRCRRQALVVMPPIIQIQRPAPALSELYERHRLRLEGKLVQHVPIPPTSIWTLENTLGCTVAPKTSAPPVCCNCESLAQLWGRAIGHLHAPLVFCNVYSIDMPAYAVLFEHTPTQTTTGADNF